MLLLNLERSSFVYIFIRCCVSDFFVVIKIIIIMVFYERKIFIGVYGFFMVVGVGIRYWVLVLGSGF